MFKELICAVALSGTIGMTAPQNSNDGTYYQDVTITETYEYETNEVNSVDDLVVGNIYKFQIDTSDINGDSFVDFSAILKFHATSIDSNVYKFSDIKIDMTSESTSYLRFIIFANSNYFYIQKYNAQNVLTNNIFDNQYTNYSSFDFYFVYYHAISSEFINYVSASDYLGEKTITITPKEFNGLFSIFDSFLHERLFSGGILDTTNVTVFNATMSLGQWLSTTTSIILLSLIVLLLVLLIKFIFKYVGGMMIWRS